MAFLLRPANRLVVRAEIPPIGCRYRDIEDPARAPFVLRRWVIEHPASPVRSKSLRRRETASGSILTQAAEVEWANDAARTFRRTEAVMSL
jgi:hypothetical protein